MGEPPYVMDYTGRFAFPEDPSALWSEIERLEHFERWWGWLGQLDVQGEGLRTGSTLTGTVAPPLPYRMRVMVHLERCEPEHLIDASVHGDLAGQAHLRLLPEGGGTMAEVDWSLEMLQLPMRVAARVAFPLLRWGHDRVVEATVTAFRAQLAQSGRARRGR